MAMGAYFTEAQKLGEHIKGAVDAGEIDDGFRNHLMTGLGLPMADRLANAEAKVKAEAMGGKVEEPGKLEQGTLFSIKSSSELRDDFCVSLFRALCRGDRATDHEPVGSCSHGFLRSHHPLLIAGGGPCGSYSRGHDTEIVSQGPTDRGDFQGAADDAPDACRGS